MPKKVVPTQVAASNAPQQAPDAFKKELGELLTRHGCLLHPVPYIDEEGRIRANVGVVRADNVQQASPTIPA